MKLAGKLIAAAVVVAAGLSPAIAGEFDKPIKVRKGLMQLYAWNIGTLGAMAKGEMEYDAAKAQRAADNLLTLTGLGDGAMWPKGSDSTANKGATRAKAEMWADGSDVGEKAKAMRAEAEKMAAVAGTGLDAVQARMKELGGACGACHKPFREEE